jgi:hypothetical protein
MFDSKRVRDGFHGMVGLLQTDSDYERIDQDLLLSGSGRFVNDLHPFFTHENFYHCVPMLEMYDTQVLKQRVWSETETYQKNDLVLSGTELFVSLQESNINNDVVDASFWAKTTLYSNYFRRKLNYAYSESVRAVINRKLGIDSQANKISIYDGRGSNAHVPKSGRFVGYKVLLHKPNLTFSLNAVSVQLTQGQTLNIYVYRANDPTPYKIIPVTHQQANKMESFRVSDVDFSSGMEASEFYIGYYEDDLTGFAVKRDVDTISMSRSCCNDSSYNFFQKYNNYVNFRGFYVDDNNIDSTNRELAWSNNEEIVINGNNFGINLNFTVSCDLTDLIIEQKTLFTELVLQTLKVSLLNDLVNTLRDNKVANNLRGLILSSGSIQEYIKIESDRLGKRLSEVSLDVNTLDSVCLPHDNAKRKIKTGSW